MKFITSFLLAILVMYNTSLAQSPEAKGLEIAKLADQADQGFESTQSNLKMILRNKQGQETTRELQNKTLEQETDGDKSLVIFSTPRDVKGTATLTFTHRDGPDDQWLYLPALKRVKRISSDNKSGPFMGSEFAYEDLSSQEVEKYTYKYIKEADANGVPCHVVERFPTDPKSGYTRQVVYWNKDNYRQEKVEFYDRKNSLLKTLTSKDYQIYIDKFWRAGKLEMVNHQSNKSTTLVFSNYAFKTGIKDSDFTQNALMRAGR